MAEGRDITGVYPYAGFYPQVTDSSARRDAAAAAARQRALNWFTNRGLNAVDYGGVIDDMISEALAGVDPNDPNPGAYLTSVPRDAYDATLAQHRENAGRTQRRYFPEGFEKTRISDTMDDPLIQQIQNEQRAKAQDYLNNLYKRGVITETGRKGGELAIAEQDPRVRSSLDKVGQGVLSQGRQSLTDVAERAGRGASLADLDVSYDPSPYLKDVDTAFNEFAGKYADQIRAGVPGDLYDLSQIASRAGSAQGPINTRVFDPAALTGANADPDLEEAVKKSQQPVRLF